MLRLARPAANCLQHQVSIVLLCVTLFGVLAACRGAEVSSAASFSASSATAEPSSVAPGSPCTLQGKVYTDADGLLAFRAEDNSEWSLDFWADKPTKWESVAMAGRIIRVEGMCDTSVQPPFAWASRVTPMTADLKLQQEPAATTTTTAVGSIPSAAVKPVKAAAAAGPATAAAGNSGSTVKPHKQPTAYPAGSSRPPHHKKATTKSPPLSRKPRASGAGKASSPAKSESSHPSKKATKL